MSSVRRSRLIYCLFAVALAITSVRAQTLIGEFALRGSLVNNVAGGAALVPVAFNGVTGQVSSLGYIFSANQGLSFTSAAFTPTNFSIELSFSLTSISSGNGYVKIADFQNLSADAGFYQLNGSLNFYGAGNIATATQTDFFPGVTVDVVLTRDGANGTVVGYVNGQTRFTFTDSSSYAVATGSGLPLNFLVDDLATGQREASGGTLNCLRIYSGALTASQVRALYAAGAPMAVPEPATAALIAVGAFGLFAFRHRTPR